MTTETRKVRLAGWGMTEPTVAEVAEPRSADEVATLVKGVSPAGAIARGLGRSYNNAAQNDGGLVLSMAEMTDVLSFDQASGVVTCEAGVSLEQLMVRLLPAGWFVPVSPGTRQVTVGGAIAADVHGKNHHSAGSFARHVLSFDLLTADGDVRTVTPESDADLFWGTAGGMGLTGIILRATIAMKPVETSGLIVAPPVVPSGLVNARTVALLNEAWFRKAPRRRTGEIQTIGRFFHPLDGIRNWNRVYGPAGFRQYQYVVPFGAEDVVRRSLERISALRAPSFVTVLRRFGEGDQGMLSFPMPGWTLALDFPSRTPWLSQLLGELDKLVLEAGGRLYLAKDSRIPAELMPRMYPRYEDFRRLRAEIDPAGVFSSDLSVRLGL